MSELSNSSFLFTYADLNDVKHLYQVLHTRFPSLGKRCASSGHDDGGGERALDNL